MWLRSNIVATLIGVALHAFAYPTAATTGSWDSASALTRRSSQRTGVSNAESRIELTLKKAGLGDIAFQMYGFGNLAVWLGATLHVQPPHLALNHKHLHANERIRTNEKWDDYLQITTVRTKERFVITRRRRPKAPKSSRCVPIHTKKPKRFLKDLVTAYNLTKHSTCVWWTVDVVYWSVQGRADVRAWFEANTMGERLPVFGSYWWQKDNPLHNVTLTDYVSLTTSPAMQRAAHNVVGDRRPYTSLHVRRGDVLKRCNTTVESIVEYSRCGVDYTPYLMVLTDETDAVYLGRLKRGLERAGWTHVYFVDDAIRQSISNSHNYRVYAVASTIEGDAVVQLSTSKQYCKDSKLRCATWDDCHPCGHSPPKRGGHS